MMILTHGRPLAGGWETNQWEGKEEFIKKATELATHGEGGVAGKKWIQIRGQNQYMNIKYSCKEVTKYSYR